MKIVSVRTSSEQEMVDAGRVFSERLEKGDLIALVGDLGAGKTHFSKGVAEGLGTSEAVTSPTFTLVHEYREGRLPIFHLDFYRLASVEELIELGWDDLLEQEGVVLVEWGDRYPEVFPNGTYWLEFRIEPDGSHTVCSR
ncbi:MAG: tRNA (adenosine(37)-N6)-threonylcarbamoyltransferase complex ATPase subunit type 1 TsaE [Verrucomicrobiota bacterium]